MIALIGGGPLPSYKAGKEIDLHDVIIRISTAPISDEIAEYIGTKTDVDIVPFLNKDMLKKEMVTPLGKDIISFYPKNRKYENDTGGIYLNDVYKEIQELTGIKKPSMGSQALHSLYREKRKADVYCFDFMESNSTWRKDYYTEFGYEYKCRSPHHDFKKEKEYWLEKNWFNFIK